MRKVAHFLLRLLAPLMSVSIFRRLVESILDLLAALIGKGGGSSWDARGQTNAVASHVDTRQDMIVLDVGANNGKWSSSLYAHIDRYNPIFHLFECAPYCFESLESDDFPIRNSHVVKKAVSNEIGETTLFLPKFGSGLASVHRREDTSVKKHTYENLTVPTITIDSYLSENGIEKVDLLKIDVEGHELAVLEGAQEAFNAKRIKTVVFEFGSANVNSRTFFRDFWNFFLQNGYQIYRIIPGGRTILIESYDDTLEYFRGCSNLIATRIS